jgi:hypothetical protein
VLAMTVIRFSNSMIEAWRRALKQPRLSLNELDSLAKVRRLIAFYLIEHNTRIPHAAFQGQTPDEKYFGTGADVPDRLAELRVRARTKRREVTRAQRCAVCA